MVWSAFRKLSSLLNWLVSYLITTSLPYQDFQQSSTKLARLYSLIQLYVKLLSGLFAKKKRPKYILGLQILTVSYVHLLLFNVNWNVMLIKKLTSLLYWIHSRFKCIKGDSLRKDRKLVGPVILFFGGRLLMLMENCQLIHHFKSHIFNAISCKV